MIEATGNPAAITQSLAVVGRMGRVVLLGSPRARLEIDPYRDIHGKGVSLIGAHANTVSPAATPYCPWTLAAHRRPAPELTRQGRLHTDGLVSHHVRAADALPIWDALMNHREEYLGVIIEWS